MPYECSCGAIHEEEDWYEATVQELIRFSGYSRDYSLVRQTLTTFPRANCFTWFMCPTCQEKIEFNGITKVQESATSSGRSRGIRSETGWHNYDDTYSYAVPEKVLIPF